MKTKRACLVLVWFSLFASSTSFGASTPDWGRILEGDHKQFEGFSRDKAAEIRYAVWVIRDWMGVSREMTEPAAIDRKVLDILEGCSLEDMFEIARLADRILKDEALIRALEREASFAEHAIKVFSETRDWKKKALVTEAEVEVTRAFGDRSKKLSPPDKSR